jgi:Rrf2 family protein
MTVAEVADNEGLSTEYAGKLLNLMRQAGLVDSIRGRNGGFVLARQPDEITIADVLRVFSGDIFDSETCQRFRGSESDCVHSTACSLRPVWASLSEMISETLERLALADLVRDEREMRDEMSHLPRLHQITPNRSVPRARTGS